MRGTTYHNQSEKHYAVIIPGTNTLNITKRVYPQYGEAPKIV